MVSNNCRIRLWADLVLVKYVVVELKIRTERYEVLTAPNAEGVRPLLHHYRRTDAPELAASHYSRKLYCREERWHCGFFVVVRSQPHTTAAFPEIPTYSLF
jgi:hypothetical protein